jgi:hypothetical protein
MSKNQMFSKVICTFTKNNKPKMNSQELKTFLLEESGDFDKFDISGTLKLSDEELNKEIQKIRKRRKWLYISRIIIVAFILFIIINSKVQFVPFFKDLSSIFYLVIILAINNNMANEKKKEYIYQLLLKSNQLQPATNISAQ